MLLFVVFRSKINMFTGTVLLLFFFAAAVLVIYTSLTSFYRDIAADSLVPAVITRPIGTEGPSL